MARILIVDDSDVAAGMVESALAEHDFEIFRAKNGLEGIKKTYELAPDLIIMDVQMPVLTGYQASRILKARRGVKHIPLIIHTALNEDKDQFWAVSSGADAFISKDAGNLDLLVEKVFFLIKNVSVDTELIREEGKELTDRVIIEMLGNIYDRQLYNSTIHSSLGDLSKSALVSLSGTITGLFELLQKVCKSHIAVFMFEYQKKAYAHIRIDDDIFKSDVDNFMKVCLNDFYAHSHKVNLEQVNQVIQGLDLRTDFDKERLDTKKISSYFTCELKGKGGMPVATLHLGNFANNYFSGRILENLETFAGGAGLILDNALLFKKVTEMRDKIRHVFSKFLPDEVITDLIERDSDKKLMIGEKRNIVVLFSDIRSFTTISETNSAEKVVSFLNRYFDTQVAIIKKHGGNIDKFIGDAIFAIFGAPVSYEDNAERALKAAMEMIEGLSSIDVSDLTIPGGKLGIGIGLHEGDAIVGNIGSSTKFDYTAIGDTVNLAARLEGLTKHYKQQILVSEQMQKKLTGTMCLRKVDYVKVKGKDIATSLFAVEFDTKVAEAGYMDRYNKAFKLYIMGNFSTALEYFTGLEKENENDYIVHMFKERCERFIQDPPGEWDGSLALDFK